MEKMINPRTKQAETVKNISPVYIILVNVGLHEKLTEFYM